MKYLLNFELTFLKMVKNSTKWRGTVFYICQQTD